MTDRTMALSLTKSAILLVIIVPMVVCCSAPVRPTATSPQNLGSTRVLERNYTIGERKRAYVGQAIVKVKDYNVTRIRPSTMMASHDFSLSALTFTLRGNRGQEFNVVGETSVGDETFTALAVWYPNLEGGIWMKVLVRDDGSVHRKVIANLGITWTVSVSPVDLKFTATREKIATEAGYVNYELVYSGTDGQSLKIHYREYTGDSLARPAFYQELVYSVAEPTIRFRDVVIQVHAVTNESLEFTVQSDSYP